MARRSKGPTIHVRRTPLKAGGVTETFTVRWYTPEGDRPRRSFGTRDEAELFAVELRMLQLTGSVQTLAQGRTTVEEFWSTYEDEAATRLEPERLDGYRRLFRQRIVPTLGSKSLADVTPRDISLLKTKLRKKGVGPESIRRTLSVLQSMFRYAVELGEVNANPAREVRKPPQKKSRVARPLTPRQVEAIRGWLWSSQDFESWMLVGVLAYLGPRPGEALALEHHHVGRRTVLIEQALRNGRLKLQKTGRRYRSVDLLEPLAEDLAWLHQQTGRERWFAEETWWLEDNWRNWRKRVFNNAVDAVGLPPMRPYDLRHSFATLLVREQRYLINDIAQQLGHQASMTLDVYGHWAPRASPTRWSDRCSGSRTRPRAWVSSSRTC